jgi:hypothetical protein
LGPGYFAAARLLIASAHKHMRTTSLRAAWEIFFFGPQRGGHFQKRKGKSRQGTFETIPASSNKENINFV